jgi:adenylate kinase
MKKGRVILLCGSPGVGKTAVADALAKKGHTSVTIGTLMKELAVSKGYVKNRDEIRYLPKETTTKLRKAAIRRISEMRGTVIVDTHVSVANGNRYTSGMPYDTVSMLNSVSGIIFMDATNRELMLRRKKDKDRTREEEDERRMDNQRAINLGVVSYYFTYLNIPLYIIHNRQGHISETVKNCLEAIENME